MEEQDSDIFLTEPVSGEQKGMRLDKFLSLLQEQNENLKTLSRSQIQRLIKNGFVTCEENEINDCAFKVKSGDVFQIEIPAPEEAEPEAENIPLDIVYEDNDLIVVNKPAGMTVHPAAGAYHGTLVNALLWHCRDNLSGIGGVKRPGIVHRIDKETSGLLVVAKTDLAHQKLSEQFFNHSIQRTYFAAVYDVPNPLSGTITGNIGRSHFDRKKMALLTTGGKHAVTHYQTIEPFKNFAALVQCNLETGRTHQIRVHLSGIGCALIGDKIYQKNHKSALKIPLDIKNFLNNFPRQALHAATLGFIHPRTGENLSFSSDFPTDFKELLAKLRQFKN